MRSKASPELHRQAAAPAEPLMRSKVGPELQARSPERLLRSSSRRQISSAVPSCTATGGVSAWLMGSRKEMSVRCPGT